MIPRVDSGRIDRRRRRFLRAFGAGVTLPALARVGSANRGRESPNRGRESPNQGDESPNRGRRRAKRIRAVVDFDPPDLPENLAIDGDGNVFVSMAVTRELRKLPAVKTILTDLEKDDTELVATLGSEETFVTGVAVADDGTLYAANSNFDPGTESVLWAVSPDGTTTQLVSLPVDAFPNGILIDADRDRLLVSDSFRGQVWAVALDGGAATTWLDHPVLDPDTFVGANGVAISGDVLHVANLDFGRIVRVPIESDGSPGSPTVLVEARSLVGADGIAFRDRSTLYVSVNAQNAIRRVNGAGEVETVVSGDPLDFPADVGFDTRVRDRLFVANFAFESEPEVANPALLWVTP